MNNSHRTILGTPFKCLNIWQSTKVQLRCLDIPAYFKIATSRYWHLTKKPSKSSKINVHASHDHGILFCVFIKSSFEIFQKGQECAIFFSLVNWWLIEFTKWTLHLHFCWPVFVQWFFKVQIEIGTKITEFVPRKVHHICILKNIMSGVFEYSFIMGTYANYQLYLLQKDVIVKLI